MLVILVDKKIVGKKLSDRCQGVNILSTTCLLNSIRSILKSPIDWFSSCLLGRKQFENLSGETFSYRNIRHGVSKESVLRPIFFLI